MQPIEFATKSRLVRSVLWIDWIGFGLSRVRVAIYFWFWSALWHRRLHWCIIVCPCACVIETIQVVASVVAAQRRYMPFDSQWFCWIFCYFLPRIRVLDHRLCMLRTRRQLIRTIKPIDAFVFECWWCVSVNDARTDRLCAVMVCHS